MLSLEPMAPEIENRNLILIRAIELNYPHILQTHNHLETAYVKLENAIMINLYDTTNRDTYG